LREFKILYGTELKKIAGVYQNIWGSRKAETPAAARASITQNMAMGEPT
jgi:hypothetical protein